jgi:hypothetical protein
MTSTAEFDGSSSADRAHQEHADSGPFMLTLCPLDAPVSIRPTQSEQLKAFTLFMSRARHRDGSEQLYLHMGYFPTLVEAQRWLPVVRRRFPNAVVTLAPAASSQPHSGILGPSAGPAAARVPQRHQFAPLDDDSLTNTQVMGILESRGVDPAHDDDAAAANRAQIGMLRPDDTTTQRALKDAVVRGDQVFFAVQLRWAEEPIDLSRVPSLEIFKAYTLYATESRRESGWRYFLRLGFFSDAMSAKDVASEVRSEFASAVVVPVTEQEFTRAREASKDTSGIAHLSQHAVDRLLDFSRSAAATPKPKPAEPRRRDSSRDGEETLEQTLKTLAEREVWTDPDALSESGVRHLKVEFFKDKIVRTLFKHR